MKEIILANNKRNQDFEAKIGEKLTYWNYINSYKESFRILIESFDKSDTEIDLISYPILFIARHCLELGFKANIKVFSKFSKKTDFTNSKSHNLSDLLKGLKLHIQSTISNLKKDYSIIVKEGDIIEFNKYYNSVEDLVDILNLLDKGSYSFRYPENNDKEKVFDVEQTINILEIKKLLEKSLVLIEYTDDLFSHYTQYVDNLEATMKDEWEFQNSD